MGVDPRLAKARRRAQRLLSKTEKALRKRIGFLRKRERISSLVAMVERLRMDMQKEDADTILRHMETINALVKAFTGKVMKRKPNF